MGTTNQLLFIYHSKIKMPLTIHILKQKNKKEFTEMMSISEMESYLKKNKHITANISSVNIVAGVSGMSYRSS